MFHKQDRQFSLSLLFKNSVHNAIRHFSCSVYSIYFCLDTTLLGPIFKLCYIQNCAML